MFNVSNWKGKEKSIKWLWFARWEDNQGFEDDKVFKYLGVPYAEKMVEDLKEETKKRILQAIDKSNGDKGDWWKFKHSFEQLGEGCYKILWYLLIGQN